MKIVVLTKAAVPLSSAIRIDPKTGTLVREGVPLTANVWDRDAVEFALKLRDRYGGEVIALSMAPPSGIPALESLIGMGVDRAILASDRAFAGADTWATAHVLAKTIEKFIPDYDLIVAGEETIDSTTAHIGAQTASWLGVPYVYYVYDAEIKGRTIVVRRFLEDEGVDEVYEVEMPAVVSVLKGSQVPREIRLSRKLDAKERIQIISNKELALDPECVGLRGSPTVVAGMAPAVYPPRKKIVLQGEPGEVARKLVEALRQEGIL
ncbi:electron transfer flavoprotein subunit beta/FixA family protein [Pyrobaculum sp. 3827-6]|uniref:electron transfer flavoprotein subunit beta/FixA family protein n=1 Tax=Pyrobaculum sp. 3827-6 TaxID=2983604 RepID=UPI0021D8B723|nr:electron transfer flavoprotein subunit beta/FixA family protein [Pyrobaculum sp. 3827-6]MCU7788162.1 electron transfer flavoprotein subunit beta/FixA family protein [Pyrobaculum sp. 3827-6]